MCKDSLPYRFVQAVYFQQPVSTQSSGSPLFDLGMSEGMDASQR